jgi:hypothetical protein
MWSGAAPRLVRREGEHPDEDEDEGDQRPRRVVAVPQIVGQPAPVPGGVAFGLDLSDAWRVGEDVAESSEQVRRILGAAVVLVEPVHSVPTFVTVTAYRAQPFTGRPGERRVSWRSLRQLEGEPAGVTVGETAYADLLGAGDVLPAPASWRELLPAALRELSLRPLRHRADTAPVLAGRPAVLPATGSLILYGARESGKTGGVRAYVRGQIKRAEALGEYLRVYVINNKGDFGALAAAAEATGGRYVTTDGGALDVLREVDGIAQRRYADQGDAYEHDPRDPLEPRCLVVIGELLKLGDTLDQTAHRELDRLLLKIAVDDRAAAVQFVTCAQLAEKAKVGPIRDACHSAVLHTESAGQTEMALDKTALRRGALAHAIPLAAGGVFYAPDRYTGWPVLSRFAWIGREDQHEALVRPLQAMAARARDQLDQAEPVDQLERTDAERGAA